MAKKAIIAKDADNIIILRKKAEYKRFIQLVGSGEKLPEHWELLASVLGVSPQTINNWKKFPEFQEARIKGINRRLQAMETSGKDDWRQWESSLRLLGVKTDQAAHQTNIQINIPILGGKSVPGHNSD